MRSHRRVSHTQSKTTRWSHKTHQMKLSMSLRMRSRSEVHAARSFIQRGISSHSCGRQNNNKKRLNQQATLGLCGFNVRSSKLRSSKAKITTKLTHAYQHKQLYPHSTKRGEKKSPRKQSLKKFVHRHERNGKYLSRKHTLTP